MSTIAYLPHNSDGTHENLLEQPPIVNFRFKTMIVFVPNEPRLRVTLPNSFLPFQSLTPQLCHLLQ